MTTADAKVELNIVERLNDLAIEMAREDRWGISNIARNASAEITRLRALEASHSRTEAITEEMIEAGKREYHRTWQSADSDDKTEAAVTAIYTAMQAARPIDRQIEGVPASPSGHSPKGGAAISVASPAKPSVPNA